MNPAESRTWRGLDEKLIVRLHHFRSPACERAALD
jgi:hypothetical protein